jgi:hypothetical protein
MNVHQDKADDPYGTVSEKSLLERHLAHKERLQHACKHIVKDTPLEYSRIRRKNISGNERCYDEFLHNDAIIIGIEMTKHVSESEEGDFWVTSRSSAIWAWRKNDEILRTLRT